MAIKLDIVTPSRKVLSETAEEVIFPGAKGEVGVLPGHAGLVSTVSAGVLRIKTGGSTKPVAIRGGFALVTNDSLTILADEAMFMEEIDRAKLDQQRAEVEKKLLSADVSVDERATLFLQRDWLMAQTTAAGL